MASDNNFQTTVDSLFKGMDSFVTTKTVVGEAVHIGETILLPLVDVTFGVAARAASDDKRNSGGGGIGGKMTPSAVLVIQNGTTKLVNIKNQDGLTKILDMVPDFVNRFTEKKSADETKETEEYKGAKAAAKDAIEKVLNESAENVVVE